MFNDKLHRVISLNEWNTTIEKSHIIEKDSHGIKVLHLSNQTFCKTFRVKKLFSRSQFINPARKFSYNISMLQELGINVPEVLEIWHIKSIQRWAIIYTPLIGHPLKHFKEIHLLNYAPLLANFIFSLHKKGIYFRSLHLGNIILGPNEQIGLIDVLDCYFKKNMNFNLVKRNFSHFFRYHTSVDFRNELLKIYCKSACLTNQKSQKLFNIAHLRVEI